MNITRPVTSRYGIITLLALIVVGGLLALSFVVQHERNRDLNAWGEKLDFIANTSARNVADWISNQVEDLNSLAATPAFRSYFEELRSGQWSENSKMHDILSLTAQRMGFRPLAAGLDDLVEESGGLALVDLNGKVLTTTGEMPPFQGEIASKVYNTPRGGAGLIDMMPTDHGANMGFVVPVYSAPKAKETAIQIGYLVAIRSVDEDLYRLLKPTGMREKTIELALVRREGDRLRYLTPLMNHALPMSQSEPANNKDSVAVVASQNLGAFGMGPDYRDKDVLFTSRSVLNTPWMLLAKVDRSEAMAASINRRIALIAGFVLVITALCTTIVAMWHHVSLRRTEAWTNEREKRIITLNQMVAMLVSLVDRRDPHAAQHSAFVAQIAAATAREMKLDSVTVETVETAAKLCNLGKMDVPAEILTRSTAINDDERSAIRSSLANAAELLTGVEFVGPVADTLRYAQEHVDGSGPYHLIGTQILISSRIIAAANSLVGMLSPRSYRKPIAFDDAHDVLLYLTDKQFDNEVIMAMMKYMYSPEGQQLVMAMTNQKPVRQLRLVS